MILQILLLIAWIYLSIVITLLILILVIQLKDNEKEKIKLLKDMKNRDIKLDKILHLNYKIDTTLHLKK